jgi:hypothetical protein
VHAAGDNEIKFKILENNRHDFLENQHLKITSNPTSKTQPTAADPMLHKNRLVSVIISFIHNGQEDMIHQSLYKNSSS